MFPRLSTKNLQRAIDERLPLDRLCGQNFTLLKEMRVADYVGGYRLARPLTMDAHDSMRASAQDFFQEDGVFLSRYDGAQTGRPYAVVVFATFLVIEFNAFTPDAHFLVLAPHMETHGNAPYRGLWDAQRIEQIQSALRSQDQIERLFTEIDRLIEALTQKPARPETQGTGRGRWWPRLFGRR